MVERAAGKSEAKTFPPRLDIIRELHSKKTKLELILCDGAELEGQIERFDQYNLLFKGSDGSRYWIPKHAVVCAKLS
ncbi:MAG TPA: hypothetical protein ENI60_08000 [Candidatus Fraserbacteria bacterium]|nr:hypothetical protein [Candidatus Fraserbacteria bacterium]